VSAPLPHDIALPLPVPVWFLYFAIIALFLLHILFVNLMVGGSTLTLLFEILGLREERYDRLARQLAQTITVNKSLAVVLGIGPLLAINLLYTLYFYSANALTGHAWALLVPGIVAAFLLAYLHKYSWDRLAGYKWLHISMGAMSTGLFWLIPFVFLANINLMLFPARWSEVSGFISAVLLPNVFPRFLHFMLASLALTALFAIGYFTRRGFDLERQLPGFTRPELRRLLYAAAFGLTLAQLLAGPLLFFTLPVEGLSITLTLVIAAGLAVVLVVLWLLWRELNAADARVGHHFALICSLLLIVVLIMGSGRHLYREVAIDAHRRQVREQTADFHWASVAATIRERSGIGQPVYASAGERVYQNVCSACHARDSMLVGPSVTEIAGIYAGDPAGIVTWTRAPGRKRAGFMQMPAFNNLPSADLDAVAQYMLEMPAMPEDEAASAPADDQAAEADDAPETTT